MGIFSAIKDAIFGHKAAAQPQVQAHAAPVGAAAAPAAAAPQPQPQPQPMPDVDVEQRLSSMAGAANLNWRSSIVDLMKLLGIDSSFENRKQLAHELGDADYSGTAEENIALHKRTMQELAKNGGKVPASMLD
jgi:3-oxoacyl-ACP reductase-like protein